MKNMKTNAAIKLVRSNFPNLGEAYSDKRKNGRRYKFTSWERPTVELLDKINKLFSENNIDATAYMHVQDKRACGMNWNGHLCIRTYDII